MARLVRYLGCADNTDPPVYISVSKRRKRKITEISADLNQILLHLFGSEVIEEVTFRVACSCSEVEFKDIC